MNFVNCVLRLMGIVTVIGCLAVAIAAALLKGWSWLGVFLVAGFLVIAIIQTRQINKGA